MTQTHILCGHVRLHKTYCGRSLANDDRLIDKPKATQLVKNRNTIAVYEKCE
jgi:hypothetical protein